MIWNVNYQMINEQWVEPSSLARANEIKSKEAFLCLVTLFCTALLLRTSVQGLCWCLSLSPPGQVRDAGRILREWHSRGKRQICALITVMRPPVTLWHLDAAWPHVSQRPLLSISASLSVFRFHPPASFLPFSNVIIVTPVSHNTV